MNISNLDKAEVFAALYNAAKVEKYGFFFHHPCLVLDREQAAQLLSITTNFDYLNGKVLKIDLSGDELDTYLYNRKNGPNAAENALKPLLGQQSVLSMQYK